MQKVMALTQRAAQSRATVLISGASGTGKELIARSIHFHSDRIGKPFVPVNCKALSPGVLESELFGHEKGAYTGAIHGSMGLFEQAHGGTLFLDEIGEIDLDFQGKLLRVLQEKEVQRVGGKERFEVDIRIVCATNKDLKTEVAEGRFREDLYFRLAVIPVDIPPLKARKEDILPLARFFVQRFASEMGVQTPLLDTQLEQKLLDYEWPGNVRELENTIERAIVLMQNGQIDPDDLMFLNQEDTTSSNEATLTHYIDRATRSHIAATLEACGGVKIEAAKRLGIERTTLYRLMKKFSL